MFTHCEVACPAVRTEASNLREMVGFARKWCKWHASFAPSPCAVFDIDQTVITPFNTPVVEVCDLFRWCLANSIACMFVTARPDTPRNREETKRALKYHDLAGYDKLFLMNTNSNTVTFESVAKYKRAARAQIGRAHTIVLNVGDQWSDLGSNRQLERAVGPLKKDARANGIFFVEDCPGLKLCPES